MKEVTYLPAIRRDKELLALAEEATAHLEEKVETFAPLVSAEWDATEERGRARITLRLWDDTGSVTTHFQAAEMRDPEQLDTRLHRVWGNLLQIRSTELAKKLEAMISAYEGD